MQGRKPLPTALKLITGNPGNRPLPDDSVGGVIAIPPAPEHFSERARAEWDRITPHLEACGLITPAYRAVLAVACDAWADYVEAREMLARPREEGGGRMVKTPNGYEVQSPWVAEMNRASEKLLKCGVEFGMTASSSARLGAAGQGSLFPDDDPMENFLRAGQREG